MDRLKDRIGELEELYGELIDLANLSGRRLDKGSLTKSEEAKFWSLHVDIERKVGYLAHLVSELSGIEKVDVGGKEYDMWFTALRLPIDRIGIRALIACTQAINRAIGKLQDDIQTGKRNKLTGELVTKTTICKSEPVKAFIAHEGMTRVLTRLREFLDALGVKYLIAEIEASNGRGVEKQVQWTQGEADFAIILATKGKAIDKKTGESYMGLNVADELGRAREVFKNHIILLLQRGVKPHTNISGIVYEPFAPQNLEKSFIKIVKELRNWGFIQVAKT